MGEQVLVERERILGDEHPDTLRTRSALATSYRLAGQIDEAIQLGERVVGQLNRLHGPRHANTLRTRSYLADSYRLAGRINEAIR